MPEQEPLSDAHLRRFFTTLMTVRARRHFATLAAAYGWSPEVRALYEERWITPVAMAPRFYEK